MLLKIVEAASSRLLMTWVGFFAYLMSGEGKGGRGGEAGAKGGVFKKKSKKHTPKKSLPASRIAGPWARKTEVLFSSLDNGANGAVAGTNCALPLTAETEEAGSFSL